jgi:hypothetical protein
MPRIEMKLPASPRESALLLALVFLLGLAVLGPYWQQPPGYHAFADQRTLWGVPRAMDVATNLLFAAMGLWGAWALWRQPAGHWAPASRRLAGLFFLGLVVTALGSAWYHLAPDDARLVADRAAMTLSFAGLMGLAASERVSPRAGTALGALALGLGGLSLWVWAQGGNLTPWAVFQGGGILLVLGLLALKPKGPGLGVSWLGVLLLYGVAKVAEGLDKPVFELTGVLSGHSLKHLLAALAAWPVIQALRAP